MRIFATAAACFLLISGTGCIIPLRNKVTGGHKYSSEALAFLSLPGTTRDEALASLGLPLLEFPEMRTLVYSWEETPRYLVTRPHIVHGQVGVYPDVESVDPDQIWLFIAYDGRGFIAAHQVGEIRTRNLREACAQWNRHRSKSP